MQIPIKSILVFHAAARAGSISRAAEELSVTPSAVSQQIQLLEGQLGTTLMARTGRKVTLTEAGERYFSMITAQIEQISDATDSIRGFRSVTALTIRATPTISNIPLFAPRHNGRRSFGRSLFTSGHGRIDISDAVCHWNYNGNRTHDRQNLAGLHG